MNSSVASRGKILRLLGLLALALSIPNARATAQYGTRSLSGVRQYASRTPGHRANPWIRHGRRVLKDAE